MGASHVHLEGDSLSVVAALKKNDPCRSSFGQLIEDTRSLFPKLHHCSIYHVKQETNFATYHLAKLATSQLLDNVWRGIVPLFFGMYFLLSKSLWFNT
jgi:hypothetical protein